jgi:hypothetical protein
MLGFGQEHGINFVFSKDGTIFTPENLAGYDAFLFYTSGDPQVQPRNGLGDNYPLMTEAGKRALLDAIREGKGFVGIHSTIEGLPEELLGAGCDGTGRPQRERPGLVDGSFPGMEPLPVDFAPEEEWYACKGFRPDLHVLLTHSDGARRSPIAWARMEGAGRVYYTGLGHSLETWQDPTFRRMLLGAIRWTTGQVSADITSNVETFAGRADQPPR